VYKRQDLADIKDNGTENPVELEAQKYGLSYIQLEGNIGCMVNGAGLAMSTMDIIKHFGGRPANFLDIGGGASSEKVSVAFKTILSDPNVKVIMVNIFGGITRCDEVARGILQAMENNQINIPLVVRLTGTNSEQGMALLSEKNIYTANSLNEAARTAIQILEEVYV
jgi:succinyl-CoA synthetase beta subunit